MFLIVFLYLITLSMSMFFTSLNLFLSKKIMVLEWMLSNINSIMFNYSILMDWMSTMFMSTVLMISSFIMLYSMSYMKDSKFKMRFIYLTLIFIFSMMLMIMSPNMLSILLGWDGLGLSSYCLVIFYQNNTAFNAGMITIILNRIGDISIMMMISILTMYGYFNIFLNTKSTMLIIIFMLIASMTKSAQLPFSSWLPAAMAAPTPISALVHSSTLVTAGVYLLIRHSNFIFNMSFNSKLLMISSLTMFMAGLMANLEMDMKKIIALSTLSQLSLMMTILYLNLPNLAFYHLITHALFKSLLFMTMGIFIHIVYNNQDLRMMGSIIKLYPMLTTIFTSAKLSLCGFPFMSGFFSKDMIMELIFMAQINLINLMLLIMSTIFTVSYSVRMIYFMLISNFKFLSLLNFTENWTMNYSMITLSMHTIFMGKMFNSIFIKLSTNLIILNMLMKMLILYLCAGGFIMGMLFFKYKFKFLNKFLSSMWYLNFIFKLMYYPILTKFFKKFMMTEKGWFEEYSSMNIIKMMTSITLNFKFLFMINNIKFFYIMFLMIIFMILL